MAKPQRGDVGSGRENSDHVERSRKVPKRKDTLRRGRPLLVFALVRTLGSNTDVLREELEAALNASGYKLKAVKLSEALEETRQPYSTEADKYEALMDAGDQYRANHSLPGALAIWGVQQIFNFNVGKRPVAVVIDKLVLPDEVRVLRSVYGRRVFIIGCDAARDRRLEELEHRFVSSGMGPDKASSAAVHAVNRDAGIVDPKTKGVDKDYRVAVGDALEIADVHVRTDDHKGTRRVIRRLVESIMGAPFYTPTLDELGMALAYQAALTTAALSRRVGAAIMVGEQIVAVGANEVPKAGGGTYREGYEPDAREFVRGKDPSDSIRVDILADLLERLSDAKWLRKKRSRQVVSGLSGLAREAINHGEIGGMKLLDVIEYTRTAHAELVAITGAARLGINIAEATLYTTTQPCHECTRNIIAAGIGRVVYLEKYAKSRGAELQSDAVHLKARGGGEEGKIPFEPFSGFVYWRFAELFSKVPRKQDDRRRRPGLKFDGKSVVWKAQEAVVRPSIFNPEYSAAEVIKQVVVGDALISELEAGKGRQ
ncbi:deaminase [Streptomyces agglomeratus]|uniref:deaminase n=1 Tax=Streptomyces agglomeratus TaxID=285458 RepID=UPI0009A0764D|nr:deaminase [Streptomyces agglomeratus]